MQQHDPTGRAASGQNGWQLTIERSIAASPPHVWQTMTERLGEWWCPKPWRTEIIAIEWRSGGVFHTLMRGPNPGEESAVRGTLLEVEQGRRFVFSDAFTAGWVPQIPFMVGCFELAPDGVATRLTAWSRHWDEAAMKRHLEMGFAEGWGIVTGQLAALCET